MGAGLERVPEEMSASGLPYRLRPNKYVDRELFAELLSVAVARKGADSYAYISMGGPHLVDHHAVMRRAGLRKFVSIEEEPDVVPRQRFNAAAPDSICEAVESGELPSRIQGYLERLGSERVIVWLDFTKPKRMRQLREVEELATFMQTGDVLRVTLNADFKTAEEKRIAELSNQQKALPAETRRALILKKEVGKYLPGSMTNVKSGEIGRALVACVGRACEFGIERSSGGRAAVPLLLTEYSDTTRMVTATVLFSDDGYEDITTLRRWEHAASDWSHVERLTIPDLSSRERQALDVAELEGTPALADILGFDFESEDVATYRKYRRFFPTFHPISD